MNSVIINKQEYINSDDLFDKAPIYCKLCRNARDLIKKKNITDYVFAKLNDTNWVISDGKSYKYDKVFFKKEFIDTIPEINQDKIILDDSNVELAPEIIYLEDSEKFKDENNQVIEIETRGERKVDGIYFKVKNVMVGFNMDNLDKVIIQKDGYIKDMFIIYINESSNN